ncbi:hypothetical protein FRB94_006196 [Tulasnella sp. JGI-2019a]|nr:hypothetical protein FRB93_006649 [Tulasnella sp. JGI-2019a]KAG8999416.1 hypothetical protein FRB94_006196 [Tulasnella sp. JGI-2019a]
MDMDMGTTSGGMMKPYLHFTNGDILWMREWVPSSPGAVSGACLGLIFLAIIERLLSAMHGVMEAWWKRKANAILQRKLPSSETRPPLSCHDSDEKNGLSDTEAALTRSSSNASNATAAVPRAPIFRVLPPFILSHDLTRAALTTARSAVGYTLMLAVMTFNASFIISILIGVFIGELLFGRFAGNISHS